MRKTAKRVRLQLLARYALQEDLIDECRRDKRVVFDHFDGRFVLFEREEKVAHVSQAMKRVTFDSLFIFFK